jgi:hypothetical protein
MPEVKITKFDGGMSDDMRQPFNNVGSLIKHFNVFDNPYKLTPYRSTEADTNDGSSATGMKQYDVRTFQLGSDGKVYGLGVNASGYPKVVSKASPLTGNWTLEATAEGDAARIPGCFIEWAGAFWFFETGKLCKWTIGGAVTYTTLGSGVGTVTPQGVIGSDNNLYVFYNSSNSSRIARINSSGTVYDGVFSNIPSNMRITSACRYGSYLAIGLATGNTATTAPTGRSTVFLWDMASTTTPSDVIDWGEGTLMCLGNVEGRLVGISDKYLSSTLGMTRGSMVIRMWSGGMPQVMKEIVANQSVTQGRFLNDVVVKNNKMYWVASVPFGLSTTTESTFNLGIWVFGRKNVNSNFTLSLDYIEEGVDTSNFKIVSFGAVGEYWFINHSADGSITRTDDTATYSFDSIYESQIFNNDNSSETKKLVGVTVFTAPMPTAGSITLKYRKDEESSWTEIFTHTTDDSISHSAINIESSGATLPQYKEIQFQITSTGGAEITGFKFKFDTILKDLY